MGSTRAARRAGIQQRQHRGAAEEQADGEVDRRIGRADTEKQAPDQA